MLLKRRAPFYSGMFKVLKGFLCIIFPSGVPVMLSPARSNSGKTGIRIEFVFCTQGNYDN